MDTEKPKTQIELLKEKGLYGSTRDPMWNRTTKMHDCCGAKRAYYHNHGCTVAGKGSPDDLSDLKDIV